MLDGLLTNYETPAETVPDLTTPSLEGLAYVLRRPALWPVGHVWDFSVTLDDKFDVNGRSCGTAGCAIGVANLLWPEALRYQDIDDTLPGGSDDDNDPATRIFYRGCDDRAITAAVVADRIDDHLAGREIRYK